MIIRALDSNGDFQFGLGKQNYLQDQNAVVLNIKTRLLSFLNDCFFDTQAGIDWLRLLGSKSTQQEILLDTRSVILQSFGVIRINSLSINVTATRSAFISYNIDSIFTSQFSQNLEVSHV